MGEKEVEISTLVFILMGLLYTYWFGLVRKHKDLRTVYFFYFLFNFLLFFGPLLYYKIGYTGYSSSVTKYSLNIFYYVNIIVAIVNIIAYQYYKRTNGTLFYSFLKKIRYSELKNKQTLALFYWITIVIAFIYIYTYREYFPLMQLFYFGELGERLDQSGTVPFYITFASFSYVFIPSAFLFLRHRYPQLYITIPLFVFTLFCLSMGGNKGLISFFLMFYIIVCVKKIHIKRGLWTAFKRLIQRGAAGIILVLTLSAIYAVLKGKTELNDETVSYLMESPFRRLFAAQGVGYIVRIELIDKGAFNSIYLVKQIVYSYIYGTPIGSGSAPTHFTGTLLIDIGYFATFIVFIFYTFFVTKILNTLSLLYEVKEDSFIVWSFFIPVYVITNNDLTLSSGILTAFFVINLVIIRFASRLKLS